MKMKQKTKILVLVLLALCLAAGVFFMVRGHRLRLAAEQRQQELDAVEQYTGVLDANGIAGLEEYRNLKTADLSGSTDYEAILAYIEGHPQVDVRYTVDLGGTAVDNRAEAATLPAGGYRLETLEENLRFLPALQQLYLEDVDLGPEEIEALRSAYPEKEISYSVEVLGSLTDEHALTLDLSAMEPEQLEQVLPILDMLPELQTVALTDSEGNNRLTLEDVSRLQAAKPETVFCYSFELFGKTVSTGDERIEFVRVPIGNDGVEQLRQVLPYLRDCHYFLLDDCGIDNEVLAQLRADFPQTKIVWRVHIDYLDFLTDVKVIHLTFLLTNENAQVMRYCNEVEFLDIGHNTISDITFMGYMPHLKCVILSFNNVRDLSPLANCKELEMLELYQCLKLQDISPLAACTSLKLLNISWTDVKDITPVYGLKNLQRFYCIWNYEIPQEQRDQCFKELPDCWITFEQNISKNVGWSFDAEGGIRAAWYLDMYKIYRYRVDDWFFGDYPEGWNREESIFEERG